MRINYNYTGDQKKRMVKAIGEALDEKNRFTLVLPAAPTRLRSSR